MYYYCLTTMSSSGDLTKNVDIKGFPTVARFPRLGIGNSEKKHTNPGFLGWTTITNSLAARTVNLAMFGNGHFIALSPRYYPINENSGGWPLATHLAFSESNMATAYI